MLELTHPTTQKVMRFTAPLHERMATVVRELRQHEIAGPVATEGAWIDLDAAIPK